MDAGKRCSGKTGKPTIHITAPREQWAANTARGRCCTPPTRLAAGAYKRRTLFTDANRQSLFRNHTVERPTASSHIRACQTRRCMRIGCNAEIVTSDWRLRIKNVCATLTLFINFTSHTSRHCALSPHTFTCPRFKLCRGFACCAAKAYLSGSCAAGTSVEYWKKRSHNRKTPRSLITVCCYVNFQSHLRECLKIPVKCEHCDASVASGEARHHNMIPHEFLTSFSMNI